MFYENLEKHSSKALNAKKKPKYKVVDKVRIYILAKEGSFRKGYMPGFSNERFTINQVNLRLPEPRNFFLDSNIEGILCRFQAHQLSIPRKI